MARKKLGKKKKVGLAISGGVDSTAAALLLKEEGYEVLGLTMRVPTLGNLGGRKEPPILSSSRKIAEVIGIKHLVVDVSYEFKEKVIAPFINDYAQGLTPNPCIVCNRTMKFGLLFEEALKNGCEFYATGHYARKTEGVPHKILKGVDKEKDQSYVLWTLNQEILSRLIFPLGFLTKKEVNKIVESAGLTELIHPESQDICFIEGRSHVEILKKRVPDAFRHGPILDIRGRKLGKHAGIPLYTVGQRRGIGLEKTGPFYVIKIIPEENGIVVGKNGEYSVSGFYVRDVNIISGREKKEFDCLVVTRYRGNPQPASVSIYGKTSGKITYVQTGSLASPGQSAVFYRDDELIGGGVITGNIFGESFSNIMSS